MSELENNQVNGQNPDSEMESQREQEIMSQLENEFEAEDGAIDTAVEAGVEESDTVFSPEVEKIAELEDQLARARAEIYNLNQQYSAYVRRSKADAAVAKRSGEKSVLSLLTAVLDDIYAAQQAGELDGPFAAIANKLEQSLGTNFQLERFGEVGEIFDPTIHEALLANSSIEVEEPTIAQILQPGYRLGEEILRAAKVVVNNPA